MAVADTAVVDMVAAAVGIAAGRDRAPGHKVVLLLLEEGTHTAVVEHPGRLVAGIPEVQSSVHTADKACFAEEAYFLVAGTGSMEQPAVPSLLADEVVEEVAVVEAGVHLHEIQECAVVLAAAAQEDEIQECLVAVRGWSEIDLFVDSSHPSSFLGS
jgi:hypothetical protein